MTKKEKATQFLKMAATGDVKNAYDKFIAANFIHHNQYFAGDRASLMNAMIEAHGSHPNDSIETKMVIEEGDKVVCVSKVRKKDGMDIAVVHIMRFEGEKVAEMWDLGQVVSPDSPNENGPI